GVHDMGGMQDFGPVVPETDEPRFHHGWERRVFGLTIAMGATGAWNLDQSRAARESLPPAQYLASSYYEIWLAGMQALMLERGLVTAEELADGRMRDPPRKLPQVLTAAQVATAPAGRRPALSRRRCGPNARSPSRHAHAAAPLLPWQARHDHGAAWCAHL